MAKKGLYRIFRTKAELDYHEAAIRDHTRQWTLDHVAVALGRMGFREKRLKEFADTMTEVFNELCQATLDDYKDDKAMWYSQELLERELREYCGKYYTPKEQRYM